ncbi:cyclic nucleotide-gated cation channel beta-3 isoform X1 [Girardinichthys multiradiatus]|uniref:cyclic nucleotide-gated cation channel beta-3 isoform X1 n=2 Tax=Girardinichthys multiradiatus TaxID=208333 RepID=UPI001FAD7ABC|nr:cyclic nucleotide-gated cation channel beta-3 isoform X1 [Girardinichthys multiradiatus]
MFSWFRRLWGAPEPPPAQTAIPPTAPAPPAKEEKLPEKKDQKVEEPKATTEKTEEKNAEKSDEQIKDMKDNEPKKEEPTTGPAPAVPAPAPASVADPAPDPAAPLNPEGAQGEEPPSTPPVVYSRYADNVLRSVIKQLRERTEILKEKAIDPYATSPEISPPVTPVLRKEDYVRQKEKEQIAKEEEDRKKAEEAAKKAEEKKKKDEEKRLEAEKKAEEERLAEEARRKAKVLPDISCSCFDVLFHPVEQKLDTVLGRTIDPFTDRRYIAWLTVVAVAYNYNVWLCPARLAFPYHSETANPFWIFFDILSDVVNIIDIVVWQPRLQFVKAGDIIKDRAMTKVHYRKSNRFKTDMFSIVPFDLLSLQFGFSTIYRFNRFIRIESFFEFSDRLESIMAKAYIWRVARTTGYLLYMLHLNACAFYVASVHQGLATTTWVYDGKGTAYLRCYYFAVRSLINIGGLPEPVTLFEIIFQMTNFFIGVFVFSSLIGQMRDVIGAATAAQTYFRASMDGCVAYMNTYTIPKLVQNRVRTWYNYTWASQGMLDESELVDKMPLVMRIAIAMDINLATFQKIQLFQGCDQQMLVDMLLRLKSIIYLPGDYVVMKGDIGKEMYIIKSGAVQVVGGPDNSIVFVTLKAGCVFGEISLLQSAKDGGNRRTANVRAYGFANLFVLEKKDLFDILVHYPESQKVLAKKGRQLIKSKAAAGAPAKEEKQKGLALFGQKPPTPKFLKAFGNLRKAGLLDKLKKGAEEET